MLRTLDLTGRVSCLLLAAVLTIVELSQPVTALRFMHALEDPQPRVLLIEGPWAAGALLTVVASTMAIRQFTGRRPHTGWAWLLSGLCGGALLGWGGHAIIVAALRSGS